MIRPFRRLMRSDVGGRIDDAVTALRGKSAIEGVNGFLFRVLGMRRTGNHAIASWIEDSVPGETLHLNNIKLGMNGYRMRYYWPEPDDKAEYTALMRDGFHRRFRPRAALLVSYEDYSYKSFARVMQRQNFRSHYGCAEKVKDVLLLRDPYNLFASRIMSGKVPTKEAGMDQKAMYLEHAETFLTEMDRGSLVCINYNRWFLDAAYRADIQRQLGLEQSDADTQFVSSRGGGSSFEGQSMDGRASEMQVLSRWRKMEDNPAFQELFADGELERYSAALFGDIRAMA
jgi:hypothetical protein